METTNSTKSEITPRHLWTNGGKEVLVVRFVSKDGTAYNGFKHPIEVGGVVAAPDWSTKAVCGGGIHGWPWGFSLGEGKECEWGALWQVYGVDPVDVVYIDGKVKFRTGTLRCVGTWHEVMKFVLDGQMSWVRYASAGASSATGYAGASSATGYAGASSATGTRGASSATGEAGASSATGTRGASSATGVCSAAVVTGLNGKVRGGEFGCVALAWWNKKKQRSEMRCSLVGSGIGSLKPNTWYQLNEKGKFVKVKD